MKKPPLDTRFRAKLKKDWDTLPSGHHKPSPYFVGREQETGELFDAIINKETGSILVAAPRGTGKTDLVYYSVSKASDQQENLLPIIFNATHLEITGSSTEEENAKKILVALITRVYKACTDALKNDPNLSKELFELYLQATGEYKLAFELESNEMTGEGSESQSKSSINFSLSTNPADVIRATVSVVALNVLAFSSSFKGLIAVAGSIGLAAINLVKTKADASKVSITEESASKAMLLAAKAKESYLRDGSFGNLEFGLKEFFEHLRKKHRPVLVIDEVDKLSLQRDSESVNAQKILSLIKTFKGLFNHSDALFIFVADEIVYDEVVASRLRRDVNATLFNQSIYLGRPSADSIAKYLGEVILSFEGDMEGFKDYITFRSASDFYNMANSLRDEITFYDGGDGGIVEWQPDLDDIRAVNKQSVVKAFVDESGYFYRKPSTIRKNENLISELYQIANSSEKVDVRTVNIHTRGDDEYNLHQLRGDFCNYLHKLGLFSRSQAEEAGIQYNRYQPTRDAGQPLANGLDTILAFEGSYIEVFQNLERLLSDVAAFISEIKSEPPATSGEGSFLPEDVVEKTHSISGLSRGVYDKHKANVQTIQDSPRDHKFDQESVKAFVGELEAHMASITANSAAIIRNLLENIGLNVMDMNKDSNIISDVPSLINHITNNGLNHFVVTLQDKDSTRVVMLVDPVASATSVDAIPGELEAAKNVKVVEVYTITRDDLPKSTGKIRVAAPSPLKLGKALATDIQKAIPLAAG